MDCHPCKRSVPVAPRGLGRLGRPVGTCHMCFTLACGFHAIRTRKGKFVCVRCELGVLAASAGYRKWASAQGDLGDPGEADITQQLIGVLGQPVRGSELSWLNLTWFWPTSPFVRSLNEWLQDRGDYGEDFLAGLRAAVDRLLSRAGYGRPDDPEAGAFTDAVGRFWETSDTDIRWLIVHIRKSCDGVSASILECCGGGVRG